MDTEIIKINKDDIDEKLMEHAGELIAKGELVAFPTETVYGLGGDALDPEASRKIYAAKGRPSDNPLIVHISEFSDLKRIAKTIPPEAKKLSDAFWPGPLTMILEKSEADRNRVYYNRFNGVCAYGIKTGLHYARYAFRCSGCRGGDRSGNNSSR